MVTVVATALALKTQSMVLLLLCRCSGKAQIEKTKPLASTCSIVPRVDIMGRDFPARGKQSSAEMAEVRKIYCR